MAKDVIITPASGKLDFYGTSGGSVLANINLTDNNDLSLSTTSGNLIIGDASRDVYIGDGTNEVDIVFEQNGEIRSVANKYITVSAGQVNATGIAVNTSSPNAVVHVYGSTPSGTVLNVEGTNGSLFSVVDNLDGTLMSVNNNAGLPVLEVFSDDSVVAGRFGQNDFVISSGGNIGIGQSPTSSKLSIDGNVRLDGNLSFAINGSDGFISLNPSASTITMIDTSAASMININTTSMHFYADGEGAGLYLDRSNARVGILKTNPSTALDVSGTVTATSFSGAGTGLTGTASSFTVGAVSASSDQAIVNQQNGNTAAWRGRILTKNSTSDKASFLGTYGSIAGVFAHNNALSAWADLYVNTTDGNTGGIVRMPTGALIAGNTIWHAGNDGTGSTLDADLLDGNHASAFVTITGNQSVGGVKTFTSQIINTTANSTSTGGGQIYLNGSTGNRIDFNQNGTAAPSFTTRSAGTKIVLFPNVGASSADYGIGIESSTLWQSVPTTSQQFKWYGGTTNIATLTGQGRFTLTSNGDYLTPTLTLLADSTTDGSLKFFPMADGAGGYITFNSNANTTTNGVLIGGTSTMTGYHASRRQGAFQWVGGTSDSTSRFEFLTANGGTTAQTMSSRMVITAQGRVGIGTNGPSTTLDVNGVTKSKKFARTYGDYTSSNPINFYDVPDSIVADNSTVIIHASSPIDVYNVGDSTAVDGEIKVLLNRGPEAVTIYHLYYAGYYGDILTPGEIDMVLQTNESVTLQFMYDDDLGDNYWFVIGCCRSSLSSS